MNIISFYNKMTLLSRSPSSPSYKYYRVWNQLSERLALTLSITILSIDIVHSLWIEVFLIEKRKEVVALWGLTSQRDDVNKQYRLGVRVSVW